MLFRTVIFLLFVLMFITHVLSECCNDEVNIGSEYHAALLSDATFCGYVGHIVSFDSSGNFSIRDPYSFVCPDGSKVGVTATVKNCGIGKCNIFGCNCNYGCRKIPEITSSCRKLLTYKSNITIALKFYKRARECAIYREAVEKTECLGARFGSPCINPGYCDIPASCEAAAKQYDDMITTCTALGTAAVALSIATSGLTLPVNFLLGGSCFTFISETRFLRDKYCYGSRRVFD